MKSAFLSKFKPSEFGVFGVMMIVMGGGGLLKDGFGVLDAGLLVSGIASVLYMAWLKIQIYRSQYTAF